MRRLNPRLGREHDLGLLAAANRRRRLGNQRRQPGVEPAGGNPGFPARQGRLQGGNEAVHVPAGRS